MYNYCKMQFNLQHKYPTILIGFFYRKILHFVNNTRFKVILIILTAYIICYRRPTQKTIRFTYDISSNRLLINTSHCIMLDYNVSLEPPLMQLLYNEAYKDWVKHCAQSEVVRKPWFLYVTSHVKNFTAVVQINETILNQYYNNLSFERVMCFYQSVKRQRLRKGPEHLRIAQQSDAQNTSPDVHKPRLGPKRLLRVNTPLADDFIWVTCRDIKSNNKLLQQPLLIPQLKSPKVRQSSTDTITSKTLSVMTLMIDSMSRLHFYRTLPKTAAFLKSITSINLKGYSRVGLNSAPNQIPLLSGYPFRVTDTYMDNYRPWIFKNFTSNDAVTLFLEEDPLQSIFLSSYKSELRGFFKAPTDYWVQPILALSVETLKKWQPCLLKKLTKLHLNYVEDTIKFNHFYGNRMFSYVSISYLSHCENVRSWELDEMIFLFLQNLNNAGVFNRTVLFILSDHGTRSGPIRHTEQGRFEAATPAAFIAFPPWFTAQKPKINQNLLINADRLTTPFDIHATWVELSSVWNPKTKTLFGLSLISNQVPENRTCRSVNISVEYCACNLETPMVIDRDENAAFLRDIGTFLMQKINSNRPSADLCEVWQLQKVLAAWKIVDQNENAGKNQVYYRIKFAALPGPSHFEALIMPDTFDVFETIERIDWYRSRSECRFDMGPYCYCKNSNSTTTTTEAQKSVHI